MDTEECLCGSFGVFYVQVLNCSDMKILNGKKKIVVVISPICGYLQIGGEIYAIEWRLAASCAL